MANWCKRCENERYVVRYSAYEERSLRVRCSLCYLPKVDLPSPKTDRVIRKAYKGVLRASTVQYRTLEPDPVP